MHSENADENWLENARNHIQGRRNDLNMLLLRSTNYMSADDESVTVLMKMLEWSVEPDTTRSKPTRRFLNPFHLHFTARSPFALQRRKSPSRTSGSYLRSTDQVSDDTKVISKRPFTYRRISSYISRMYNLGRPIVR